MYLPEEVQKKICKHYLVGKSFNAQTPSFHKYVSIARRMINNIVAKEQYESD